MVRVPFLSLPRLCPGLWRSPTSPRAQLACSGATMWQSGTAPPRRDIWVLGGRGRGDRWVDRGQGACTSSDAWAPGPREPWGWHRSLLLAPVPIVGNRPGRVLECQILGFRRGAGSALSRKSLSTRCGGGEQAGQSLLLGGSPLPKRTARVGRAQGSPQGQ